jgi:hypothetical protein
MSKTANSKSVSSLLGISRRHLQRAITILLPTLTNTVERSLSFAHENVLSTSSFFVSEQNSLSRDGIVAANVTRILYQQLVIAGSTVTCYTNDALLLRILTNFDVCDFLTCHLVVLNIKFKLLSFLH